MSFYLPVFEWLWLTGLDILKRRQVVTWGIGELISLDANCYICSNSSPWVLDSLGTKSASKILSLWLEFFIKDLRLESFWGVFRRRNLTSKLEYPHKLSFFSRLCLINIFWPIICGFELFSGIVWLSESGSDTVMPQSISSRRGSCAVAYWMPPSKKHFQVEEIRINGAKKYCI